MACAVAALISESSIHIEGWEAISTSYPDFTNDLECLSGEGV